MAFGKWNTGGSLSWVGSDTLYATQLNETISGAFAPIGTIIPWYSSIGSTPSLFPCWVLCNGSQISDANSPLNGQYTPNLNGAGLFLRGYTTTTGSGGTLTHTHATGVANTSPELDNYGTDGDCARYRHTHGNLAYVENRPPFCHVVYIMRIK